MTSDQLPYRVSAIVSTCNAHRFIEGCLEDLESQTISDQTEIIVIDSASEQNEGDIVRSFQKRYDNIRYLRTEKRETVYGAWNRGIAMAGGEYITNANTDDRHRNAAFEQMVKVLDESPDVALVYADVLKTRTGNQTYDQCLANERLSWFDWDRRLLLKNGCFIGPQPMWRRKVHAVFGDFDENLVTSGDYEYWLRISQLFDCYHIREPLGLYLDRPNSVEHAHSDLKSAEDLQIQAAYARAAVGHRLMHCRPLKRLQKHLVSHDPKAPDRLSECLQELEPFICPDVQGRRVTARFETENYLELKYRILSGKATSTHSEEVIEVLSRLMLKSMRWYRLFWDDLGRKHDAVSPGIRTGLKPLSAISKNAGCDGAVKTNH
jgi:glycosyltransferase involved in cell wall biosynthesis